MVMEVEVEGYYICLSISTLTAINSISTGVGLLHMDMDMDMDNYGMDNLNLNLNLNLSVPMVPYILRLFPLLLKSIPSSGKVMLSFVCSGVGVWR